MAFLRDWVTKKRFEALYEAEKIRFGLSVTGKDWLCPYCLQVIYGDEFAALDDTARKEKVFEHVMACKRAQGMEGQMLPLLELRDVVDFRQHLGRYQSEPAMRIFGPDKRWVCPYCREVTRITPFDSGGAKLSTDRLVRAIQKHLKSCFEYEEHPDRHASVKDIKEMFAAGARREKFAERAAEVMRTNPVFRFKDAEGHWVCPFCEAPVRFVDMSTDLLTRLSAPRMAAKHFIADGCKGYEADLVTDKTVAEMQALVESIDNTTTRLVRKPKPSRSSEDEAYLRDLRAEVASLKEEIRHSDDLERSLMRAREVQEKMLPDAVPEIPGYEFAAFYRACDRVGGDFYDFIDLRDGRLGIVMGDVSGHGLEAALVMGMTKKAFSLRARETDSPAEVMRRVNADVFSDIEEGMFITAFYGVVDPAAAVISFARAGHNLPLIFDPNIGAVEEIRSPGMMLGADSGRRFDPVIGEESRPLDLGSVFLQYTDGLTEAMNPDLEEFGLGRLSESLERSTGLSAQQVIESIVADVERFGAGAEQEDDFCLVAVRRLGVPAGRSGGKVAVFSDM